MKPASLVAIVLIALSLAGCSSSLTGASRSPRHLNDDEKHRLYSAALAASDSPLDTDMFKRVCREIGIVDASGHANDQYMTFMSEHVNWGMKPETEAFRQEINTQEKAKEYLSRNLP